MKEVRRARATRTHKRMRVALVITGCSLLTAGCVAPLVAGLAAGAGVFGVGEGTAALGRRELANDARLRHISAASLGATSQDIATISEKDWRSGILHWVATHRDGRRFRCESGAGSAICTPYRP